MPERLGHTGTPVVDRGPGTTADSGGSRPSCRRLFPHPDAGSVGPPVHPGDDAPGAGDARRATLGRTPDTCQQAPHSGTLATSAGSRRPWTSTTPCTANTGDGRLAGG